MPRLNPAMGSSSLPPHPKTFSGGSCSVLYFCDTFPVFRMCLVPNFYQMETECVVCLVILSLLHTTEFFFLQILLRSIKHTILLIQSVSINFLLFSQRKHNSNHVVAEGKSVLILICQWQFSHAAAKSLQSRPTLCDPIDGRPPGSLIPGMLQARTLEWVAISFSNA